MPLASQPFFSRPPRWGLRVDPYLWQEFEQIMAKRPLPASQKEIENLLASTYLELVGEAPGAGRRTYVARYAHGGMSSGCRFLADAGSAGVA